MSAGTGVGTSGRIVLVLSFRVMHFDEVNSIYLIYQVFSDTNTHCRLFTRQALTHSHTCHIAAAWGSCRLFTRQALTQTHTCHIAAAGGS